MSVNYQQALADRTYLWETYGPAYDMTGGYVDQEDLDQLLRNPTKATALRCLTSQIVYWFQVGPDTGEIPTDDERVDEIQDRYC